LRAIVEQRKPGETGQIKLTWLCCILADIRAGATLKRGIAVQRLRIGRHPRGRDTAFHRGCGNYNVIPLPISPPKQRLSEP
jgi:hypothetical protein